MRTLRAARDGGEPVGLPVDESNDGETPEPVAGTRRPRARLTSARRLVLGGDPQGELAVVVDGSGAIVARSPWTTALDATEGPAPDLATLARRIVHPDDLDHALAVAARATEQPGCSFGATVRMRDAGANGNGHWRPYALQALSLVSDTTPGSLLITGTETPAGPAPLAASSDSWFHALVQHSTDLIVVIDTDGVVRYASPAVAEGTGWEPEALVGSDFSRLLHAESRPLLDLAWQRALGVAGRPVPVVYRIRHRDGSYRFHEGVLTNLLDEPEVRALVVNARDVTERKRVETKLTRRHEQDHLTGLPNRTALLDHLGRAVVEHQARTDGNRVGLVVIDLDRFNLVNDTFGHRVADRLLVSVASRLRSAVRPIDAVARIGDDTFAIVCNDLADEQAAAGVAERVQAAMGAAFLVEGRDVFLSASIGVAVDHGVESAELLLRDADAAAVLARDLGGSRFEIASPKLAARAASWLQTETDLRHGLDRQEFVAYFQPTVALPDGSTAGAEALLRWRHPERDLLLPGAFLAIAEATGLIIPLGMWVLEEASRTIAELNASRPADRALMASVNLSARQFVDPDLPRSVAAALDAVGLPPEQLTLEITETVAMQDAEHAVSMLRQLKDQGVMLALDDFGTGLSSLSYVKRLPIDFVKIDRSFVSGLGSDAADLAIVEAIIRLSSALGLQVVAEGVEEQRQLDALTVLGCDYAQGHHFAPAQPVERFTELLAAEASPVS